MNKKLNKLTQIDGKLKDKENKQDKNKEKCTHNSYKKIEENGLKHYQCNDCPHTWS